MSQIRSDGSTEPKLPRTPPYLPTGGTVEAAKEARRGATVQLDADNQDRNNAMKSAEEKRAHCPSPSLKTMVIGPITSPPVDPHQSTSLIPPDDGMNSFSELFNRLRDMKHNFGFMEREMSSRKGLHENIFDNIEDHRRLCDGFLEAGVIGPGNGEAWTKKMKAHKRYGKEVAVVFDRMGEASLRFSEEG